MLQRVFREIDEDNTGSISVEELQKALQYHIVSFVFVEIASYLEAQGGIVEAFEGLQPPEIVVGLLPRGVAVPKVPAPPRLPLGEEGVSEEKFLRVLRQLKAAFSRRFGGERAVFPSMFKAFQGVFEGSRACLLGEVLDQVSESAALCLGAKACEPFGAEDDPCRAEALHHGGVAGSRSL